MLWIGFVSSKMITTARQLHLSIEGLFGFNSVSDSKQRRPILFLFYCFYYYIILF